MFERMVHFLKLFLSYEYGHFYLRERELGEEKETETDWIPKVDNYVYKEIHTGIQLDELLNEGYDLSLLDVAQARQRLAKGAITSLVFVNNELAFKQWLAFSEKAKTSFNEYPYKVDFNEGEACSGDAWTNPRYRKMGLYSFAGYKRRQLLINEGRSKVRWIVLIGNDPVEKAYQKFNKPRIYKSKTYAKARYLRIFGLKFWKETPLD